MKPEDPIVLQNPVVIRLAEKYKKSPAQVCIKWVLQRNALVLVKSVTPERIRQNMDVSCNFFVLLQSSF
jgi:alcohol dehydrogenase (NADP+)